MNWWFTMQFIRTAIVALGMSISSLLGLSSAGCKSNEVEYVPGEAIAKDAFEVRAPDDKTQQEVLEENFYFMPEGHVLAHVPGQKTPEAIVLRRDDGSSYFFEDSTSVYGNFFSRMNADTLRKPDIEEHLYGNHRREREVRLPSEKLARAGLMYAAGSPEAFGRFEWLSDLAGVLVEVDKLDERAKEKGKEWLKNDGREFVSQAGLGPLLGIWDRFDGSRKRFLAGEPREGEVVGAYSSAEGLSLKGLMSHFYFKIDFPSFKPSNLEKFTNPEEFIRRTRLEAGFRIPF